MGSALHNHTMVCFVGVAFSNVTGSRTWPVIILNKCVRNSLCDLEMSVISARVHESAVIPAPISTVWKHVRSMSFSWWSLVSQTTCEGPVDQVGSTHTISYKDGSKWTVRWGHGLAFKSLWWSCMRSFVLFEWFLGIQVGRTVGHRNISGTALTICLKIIFLFVDLHNRAVLSLVTIIIALCVCGWSMQSF